MVVLYSRLSKNGLLGGHGIPRNWSGFFAEIAVENMGRRRE